ncbi:MAG TPA: hypothetical protein EYP25_12805 [Anaerolineae bacterium]|nr:hypothetical protein [Anaerolineae bacterium]
MERKKGLFWLLTVLLAFILLGSFHHAQAMEIREGEEVVIPAGEIIEDDLYATGQRIVVDGVIQGDLVAMGGTVVIQGEVDGDLMVMAQSLVIDGVVTDDVRGFAQTIQVASGGHVGDDLIGFGFSLDTQKESEVGGTVLFFGGQAFIAGDVGEDVKISTNGFSLQGRVAGDVKADVGSAEGAPPTMFMYMPNMPAMPIVPGGLTVGDQASVGGTLAYQAPQEASIPPHIRADYTPAPEEAHRQPTLQDRVLTGVRLFVSLLLVGFLLLLLPAPREGMLVSVRQQFGKTLLWGVIAFIGGFVLFILLALALALLSALLFTLTLGKLGMTTLMVGLTLLALYSVGLYVVATWWAQALMSLWLGQVILGKIKPEWRQRGAWSLLLGAFLVALLLTMPYLGGLLRLFMAIMGLGALLLWWIGLYRGRGSQALPTPSSHPEPHAPESPPTLSSNTSD